MFSKKNKQYLNFQKKGMKTTLREMTNFAKGGNWILNRLYLTKH